MSLEQWSRIGWLQRREVTVAEVQKLFKVVDRDLSDADAQGLSPDGRFQHAYDAALQLCVIPLRACGYVVQKGQGNHKLSIDSLRYTLGTNWAVTADHVERCSRLRGHAVYEEVGLVTDEDASDLLNLAKQLRIDVISWIKQTHAELVPAGL